MAVARVIIEFESDEDAQRFVDGMEGYVYLNLTYSDWDSIEATIADDSPVQPTPPKTVAELRRERKEHKQALSRNHLQEYVDRATGVEKGPVF